MTADGANGLSDLVEAGRSTAGGVRDDLYTNNISSLSAVIVKVDEKLSVISDQQYLQSAGNGD